MFDLVRQLTPAPVVYPAYLTARALDDGPKTPNRVLDLLLVELGDNYEHNFVSAYLRLLRSTAASRKADGPTREAGAHKFSRIVYQYRRFVTNPLSNAPCRMNHSRIPGGLFARHARHRARWHRRCPRLHRGSTGRRRRQGRTYEELRLRHVARVFGFRGRILEPGKG